MNSKNNFDEVWNDEKIVLHVERWVAVENIQTLAPTKRAKAMKWTLCTSLLEMLFQGGFMGEIP